MKVTGISSNNFRGIIIPSTKQQPKYLYNEVSDLVSKYRIPAVFANKYIELPQTCKELLEDLVKKGISYTKKEPK